MRYILTLLIIVLTSPIFSDKIDVTAAIGITTNCRVSCKQGNDSFSQVKFTVDYIIPINLSSDSVGIYGGISSFSSKRTKFSVGGLYNHFQSGVSLKGGVSYLDYRSGKFLETGISWTPKGENIRPFIGYEYNHPISKNSRPSGYIIFGIIIHFVDQGFRNE